ncbi:MAG: flagellar protein FlaB, partial [Desulfobacterales bacterium]|nr:flagellar protein FlaB [Desulfobacterales bacterium]
MALKINTNIAALNAHKSMVKNDGQLSESLARLSSGLRINKAADDSSGMAIADSLKAQSLGIGQAIRNANDGISIVQTADGALEESINIVNTIKTKAIQAASDGQTTATRRAIQNDIDKLLEELDAIAKTTAFNGQKLLSGAFTNKSFQIGAFAHETADISIDSTESGKIGHISQAKMTLASSDGGDIQLSITSSITGEVIDLSNVNIAYNNKAGNGMGALADEVNRYTSITGITAAAVVQSTTELPIKEGSTGSDFAINGIPIGAIPVKANDSGGALVSAINGKSAETGVEAFKTPDGKLTLKSTDGRAIKVSGSVSDVMGSTSGQMSTVGYLSLTQEGVSQFQINGIGAGATGADITISGEMDTVEDSVLASGTTIAAGSKLAANSIVGGDVLLEATASNTQLDYKLKTGSTLHWGSDLSMGTILGANITVGGNLGSSGTNVTSLDQDMLLSAGSRLAANSVIGKGTVVTTQFDTGGGGPTYAVGTTLSSAVTLGSDLTLVADMTLAYNGSGPDNSAIEIGSSLNTGTVLGATFTDIGLEYSLASSGTNFTSAVSDLQAAINTGGEAVTSTGGTITLLDDIVTSSGDATIPAGSLLAGGSVLNLSKDSLNTSITWAGPTLITTAGVIEAGDNVSTN